MPTGAGRTPLIIAGVAAVATYLVFGSQTPFGFLHSLNRHHHAHPNQDSADADQAARDAAQAQRDAAQATRDAMQQSADAVREARDGARRAVETAGASGTTVEIDGKRLLDPFDSIAIENQADIAVTIGDTQSVTVTGGDGNESRLQTRVRDGKLIVSGSASDAHLAITVPHLRALQVNGAGQVTLDGLKDPISITTNGAIQLTASGSVDSVDLTLNGPSKAALTKLAARNMKIRLNGLGDADVNATDTLTADVSGVGHVRYVGDPHTVSTVHGLGSVERLHES